MSLFPIEARISMDNGERHRYMVTFALVVGALFVSGKADFLTRI